MSAQELADPELLASEWDLAPLVDAEGDDGARRLLEEAATRAEAFAASYAGRVAELDADGLRDAMRELASISELAGSAASYASLRFSTDTADPARGALLAHVQEQSTAISTNLLFFELEWAALDDADAEALLDAADLDFCRHYLRSARRYRPHLLSEPEERILAEKSIASEAAWERLFSELVSAVRVQLDEEEVSLDVALSQLLAGDRAVRRGAADAVTTALAPGLRTRAFIYNTLVQEKAVDDRLRNYPNWMAARNLANEVSDESVTALIEAVRNRYDIPQRWYRLKAQLLGLDRLADYDRSAPLATDEVKFAYSDARELVLSTYSAFSPTAGAITRRFFDEHWIDAPVRPNKRGGAFCSYTVPSAHPYVMLNYTSRRRDVLTMAHELGHGLHAALAQPRGVFHQSTPLTLAETASVFGETLVFERMLEQTSDDRARLDLLADRIDGAVATVFRQIAMNRFEDSIHTRRRERGRALHGHDLWDLAGDPVRAVRRLGRAQRLLPDLVVLHSPLHRQSGLRLRLRLRPAAGAVGIRPLSRGGRAVRSPLPRTAGRRRLRSPEELGAIIGIDLSDPGFWDAGLRLVEEQLAAAETLAAAGSR